MSGNTTVGCPGWCSVQHGHLLGEDDLVHSSAEVVVCHVPLRLCAGPTTGRGDGPFVLVGDHELNTREAELLVGAVTRLIGLAASQDKTVTRARPSPP
jgi:hypothetical protein